MNCKLKFELFKSQSKFCSYIFLVLLTYSVKASVMQNIFKVKNVFLYSLLTLTMEKLGKTFFSSHSLKKSYMIEVTNAFINYEMLLSFPGYSDSQKQWCFCTQFNSLVNTPICSVFSFLHNFYLSGKSSSLRALGKKYICSCRIPLLKWSGKSGDGDSLRGSLCWQVPARVQGCGWQDTSVTIP